MTEVNRVVIVGASHAGSQAAFALRKYGWDGEVVLIGAEPELPYHRPPLSKTILTGDKQLDQIFLRAETAYADANIELQLGARITDVDSKRHTVVFDNGERLTYSHLILATGATPRRLPVPGGELAGVHSLRDMADIKAIQNTLESTQSAVVIGGGYIGLEVAATLRKLGKKVSVVEAADRLLARVTDAPMSEFYQRVHEEEGVSCLRGAQVTQLHGAARVSGVELATGDSLAADLVVIGIGVVPESELARAAGAEIDNGVKTDEFAQTSVPGVFAIGDCANTWHPRYQSHLRVESVQNAGDLAMIAAQTICGEPVAYGALPWFWSDQFDVKLQIAGLALGADTIVQRGSSDTGRSFSRCHLRGNELLAVEAVNQPRDFAFSRQLLSAGPVLVDPTLLGDRETSIKDCVLPAS